MLHARTFAAILLSTLCVILTSLHANADVYLHEGFNGSGLPTGWSHVRLIGTQSAWSVVSMGSNPNIPPYAGTGMAKFNSFDAAAGEQARLISPRIDLTIAADPFLTLFMYHDDEYLASLDSLYIEVTSGDSITGPWVPLLGMQRPRSFNAWRKEAVSLFAYRGMSRVFLSLRGVSRYGNNIFVDEFRIADSSFYDIGVISLAPSEVPTLSAGSHQALMTASRVPERTKRDGNPQLVHAFVPSAAALIVNAIARNFGTFDVTTYAIGWTIDGIAQPSFPGGPLQARTGFDTTALVWMNPISGFHTFTAWSVHPLDSNSINDTARITSYVLESGTVFYEMFNGNAFPPPGWVTINRDGSTLPAWFRGTDTSAFLPFEGTGFAANNFQRANGTYLDDYLISPQIPGVGQPGRVDSLVFRVRSQLNPPPAPNYLDSLMILLSTGGADTSDFTILIDYFPVPKGSWVRRAYPLAGRVPPNSTIRVAFRYLLYNVQLTGGSGDFIGIDAVRIIRGEPASVQPAPVPSSFLLEQNYPNPFSASDDNSMTTIRFTISAGTEERAFLRVYDILGREVVALINGQKLSGTNAVTFDGHNLPSGIYFYELQVGLQSAVRKMLLIR